MSNQPQVNTNQNNNFAQSLFLSSLNKSNEKNQKAEDQGLLALSSVLSTIESTLSGSMKGITHASTNIDVSSTKEDVIADKINISSTLESHSIASIAKILGAASAATNKLEEISSKSASDQTDDMSKISATLIKLANTMPQHELQMLVKQMQETFFGTSDENKGSLNNTSIQDMQKSLAKLAETLTAAKEGGPTNYQLIQALSEMTSDVSTMQGTIAKVSSDEAKSSASVSEALVTAAQANQVKVANEVAAQEAEQKKEATRSLIGKIVGAIISVVIAVCTFGSGAPVMATLMLGMAVLSESGALTKLSGAIASSLQNDGMSPDAAKALADALTVVVVVTATVVAGGVGSKTLVKDAAVDATKTAAKAATKEASEAVAKSTYATIKDNVAYAIKKVGENNPFRKLSATTNMAIAAGFQTAQQTGAVSDAATAIMKAQGASQDQIDAVVQDIKYTMGAVSLVVSAAALDGGMNGITSTTTVSKMATTETITKAMKVMDISANVVLATVKSGIDIDVGVIQEEIANTQYQVSQSEAAVELFNAEEKANNDLSQINMKATTSAIQADAQVSQAVQQEILAGQLAFAQISLQAV